MAIEEAIMYYKDRPVEFVQDIIKAEPDEIQKEILNSVAKNSKTSVRSRAWNRKISSIKLANLMVFVYKTISKNTVYSPNKTPIV